MAAPADKLCRRGRRKQSQTRGNQYREDHGLHEGSHWRRRGHRGGGRRTAVARRPAVGVRPYSLDPGRREAAAKRQSDVAMVPPQPYGITFTPQPAAQPAVPEARAVSAALYHTAGALNGQLRPGVTSTAEYGVFSDDQMAAESASGQQTLLYRDRPVWIVTFSGPGLLASPVAHPAASAPLPVRHPLALGHPHPVHKGTSSTTSPCRAANPSSKLASRPPWRRES